jgi:hypothetical protein
MGNGGRTHGNDLMMKQEAREIKESVLPFFKQFFLVRTHSLSENSIYLPEDLSFIRPHLLKVPSSPNITTTLGDTIKPCLHHSKSAEYVIPDM